MRLWRRSIWNRIDSIPRPVDEPRGHAPGPDPVRVLLIGNGAGVGYGVRSHELALPGEIARQLASGITRGVDVVSVTGQQLTAARAIAALDDRRSGAREAAVVTLGFMEALSLYPPKEWTKQLSELIGRLRRDSPDLPILFVGPYDIRAVAAFDSAFGSVAQRHAEHLNSLGRSMITDDRHASWHTISAPRADMSVRHRAPGDFQRWGMEIAAELARLLDRSTPGWRTCSGAAQPLRQENDEAARVKAVERFKELTSTTSVELDRVVDLAQRVFGTKGAAITLIDGETQWVQTSSGVDGRSPDGIPREDSICFRTIEQDGVMVVPDARLDARFAGSTHITTTRFYAGYPLVSPEGHRLGALCVFDPTPGDGESFDRSLLREVGLLAQKTLWNIAAIADHENDRPAATGSAGSRS